MYPIYVLNIYIYINIKIFRPFMYVIFMSMLFFM